MEIYNHILAISAVLGGLGVISVAVVKLVDWVRKPARQANTIQALDEKHDADMKALQAELQIICYGLRGALQGLIETGCNGPCKEALNMLDKHLNKNAHEL